MDLASIDRSLFAEALIASLPGLVHFCADPLVVPVGREVRLIRIGIPGTALLSLQRLTFDPPLGPPLPALRAAQSSYFGPPRPPEQLLLAKPIHTDTERDPFWSLDFDSPRAVQSLSLYNRPDGYAYRAAGLRVEIRDADGGTLRFDNLDAAVLARRLATFEEQLAALLVVLAPALPDLIGPIESAAARLLNCVELLFAGRLPTRGELFAARLGLLRSLLPLADVLQGAALKQALLLVAPVLNGLIRRGPDESYGEERTFELQALALFYTAEFLAKRSVGLSRVRECEGLISRLAHIEFLDSRISELYASAGGDRAVLPIMVRKHGVKGSELNRYGETYVAALVEVSEACEAIGYEAALCYGTFLGAVRGGDFIPHDDDVDMAVALRGDHPGGFLGELKQIAELLTDRGLTTKHSGSYDFLKVRAPKAKKMLDLFPIVPSGPASVKMFMESFVFRDVPRHCVLPFGRMEFRGKSFSVPASAEGFLTERYGPDWRVPQRAVGIPLKDG